MGLINCNDCGHEISKTALVCPACGRIVIKETLEASKDDMAKSTKILGSIGATALIVAMGPAAILGAAASIATGLDKSEEKSLRKLAKKLEAIDSFVLSNDCHVFVGKNIFYLPGLFRYEKVPWKSIKEAYIDVSKSRDEGLIRSAKQIIVLKRINPKNQNEIITKKYMLTGYGNTKDLAQIACAKFNEYASI